MIAPFLATAARASVGCLPLDGSTVPGAGEIVPPDVVFTVIPDAFVPGCEPPVVALYGDRGDVASEVELLDGGVVRLRPSAPLEPGAWAVLLVADLDAVRDLQVPVRVGDVPPPSPGPVEVALEVERRCEAGEALVSVVAETVGVASGVMVVDYTVGADRWTGYAGARDQARIVDERVVVEGSAICAEARFEDLSGAEVWSAGRRCHDGPPCGSYGRPEAVTSAMEASCNGGVPATRVIVDIDLPVADADAWGELSLDVSTSLAFLEGAWSAFVSGADGDTTADLTVVGAHDVCFDVVLRKGAAEIWRDGPHCPAEPVACPAEPRPAPVVEGCGCGGRRPTPVLLALLVLGAARRRATP